VVERGKCDAMYIVTTGVGVVHDDADLSPQRVRPGDKVLLSGTVGDHGIAILLARGDLDIEADVRSDTQPLWSLASALISTCGDGLHCMRDATRGGAHAVRYAPRSSAPARSWASTRSTSPTRASSSPSSREPGAPRASCGSSCVLSGSVIAAS
jgi:hypothetical protein